MPQNWVVRTADNVFLRGGFMTSMDAFNPATETAVVLSDDVRVDVVQHRYDATTESKIRVATQVELDAAKAAYYDARFDDELTRRILLSLGRATWEQLPAGKPTWLAFKARVRLLFANFEQIP